LAATSAFVQNSVVREAAPGAPSSSAPATAPAPRGRRLAPAQYTDIHWRSLGYFNFYRVVSALVFGLLAWRFAGEINLGAQQATLYLTTCAVYAALGVVFAAAIWSRKPAFRWQLSVHVLTDIVCVLLLMYASGGTQSSLGLMLFISLAAAGLISRGRYAFVFAAVATLGVLGLSVYSFWAGGGEPNFVQTGLMCAGYFAVAALAHTLARYAQDTERLAAQRGIDLANVSQINEVVIRDMKDGVLVVDADYRVRTYNERAESLLGPMPLGATMPKLQDYSAELAGWLSSWRRDPSTAVSDMRSPVTAAPMRLRYVPIDNAPGSATLVFLEDMSQEQSEARQIKLAALGRLTANIAHEIRNPLSAISHAAELLGEEGERTEVEARMLRIIRENAVRLDRMVQEVLQLNRRDRAQPEAIDPAAYLHTFVNDFCQMEKVDKAVFSLEIDSELTWHFDRNHLHQVLWNLTRNAYRHGQKRPGSVRLCLNKAPMHDFRQLDIIDDGPGVDPEMRNRLFEPFFTTANQGTGLGLYIARELCEANGAFLDYVDVAPGGQFRILVRGPAA
jgi:two-component system, NtrC family, sensor histidine kinase PilS